MGASDLIGRHTERNGEPRMMLRIDFQQQWFNLSDPGVEEALILVRR